MATIKNIVAVAVAVFFSISASAQDRVDYTTANNESAVLSQMNESGNYYRVVAEIEDPSTGKAVAHVLAQKRQTDWAVYLSGGADYIRDQFAPVASIGLKYRGVRVEAGLQGGISTLKHVESSDLAGKRYLSYQAKGFASLVAWESKDVYKRHRFLIGAEGIFSSNRFFQATDEEVTETDNEIIRTINGHHVKGYSFGAMATLQYENMISPKRGIFFGIKGGAGYITTYNRTNEKGLRGHKGGLCANAEVYIGVLLNKTKKSPLYYELYGFNQTNAKVNELRGAQGK